MHKLFADWYRQVDLNVSAEGLNARWKCIEAAVKKLDAHSILQLTRASFLLPKPDRATDADGTAICLTFKEADISFPMKGNDQLLRVLFGVVLAQCIEQNGPLATLAALAVASARCFGLVAPPPVEELVSIAEQHLSSEGAAQRSSALEDPVVLPKFGKVDITQPGGIEIVDPPNATQWPQVQQNFQRLGVWGAQVNASLQALTLSLSKTLSETTSAFKANSERNAIESRLLVLKEECNVLWWIFGEYSESVRRSWSDAKADEICVVVGRELAALMAFGEPAPNASSFLAKALSRTVSSSEGLDVKQLLNLCSGDPWKGVAQAVRETVQLTNGVTPVHTGLVHRIDSSSRWVELVAETTALRPEQRLTPLQWAQQAYREALLIKEVEIALGA